MNPSWDEPGSATWTYDECFTSYSHPKNIIENESGFIIRSSSHNLFFDPEYATSAYFRQPFRRNSVFCSNPTFPGTVWWKIDLKKVLRIEYISVIPVFPNFFRNFIYRFGIYSDFTKNPVIYSHIGKLNPVELMPFIVKPTSIVYGQILSIETQPYVPLCFSSLQIIEY